MSGLCLKPKKARHYPEYDFEDKMRLCAPLFKCMCVKIPDAIKNADSLKKRANGKGYSMAEFERPFDGLFITEYGTLSVEYKANYNTLEDHQVKNLRAIYEINRMAAVFRVKESKGKNPYDIVKTYTLELPWIRKEPLYKTTELADFVKYIKEYVKELNYGSEIRQVV